MTVNLSFLGAAGTVTGSKYLVENGGNRILVDCGLFQGFKPLRLRDWDRFPVDPRSLSSVVLTHAHLDHSGYLPLLIKNGYSGPVYCSHSTVDFCEVLLPDAGFLARERRRICQPAWVFQTQASIGHTEKHSWARFNSTDSNGAKGLRMVENAGKIGKLTNPLSDPVIGDHRAHFASQALAQPDPGRVSTADPGSSERKYRGYFFNRVSEGGEDNPTTTNRGWRKYPSPEELKYDVDDAIRARGVTLAPGGRGEPSCINPSVLEGGSFMKKMLFGLLIATVISGTVSAMSACSSSSGLRRTTMKRR